MSVMHDLERPLNDLKEIKSLLGAGANIGAMNLIDKKIKEYETDIDAVEAYFNSDDYKEGYQAFLNGKKPVFTGQ